jgi:hypothetical protein
MLVEVRKGTGDATSSATRFLDLSFPSNRTVVLLFQGDGAPILRYDQDGDGSVETAVPPTVEVSGTQASDVVPPTVTLSSVRQGNFVTVTLSAEDRDSGVKQIFYSTDGSQFAHYDEPLAIITGAEPAVVLAFADDRAGNRSGLYRYSVVADRPKRLFLPTLER